MNVTPEPGTNKIGNGNDSDGEEVEFAIEEEMIWLLEKDYHWSENPRRQSYSLDRDALLTFLTRLFRPFSQVMNLKQID